MSETTKLKRRPGRDPEASNDEVKIVDVETGATYSSHGGSQDVPEPEKTSASSEPKIEINFAGSEVLRAKFPKPFEVAEKVATDWVHDGKFENLPVGSPLAQQLAGEGLRKAKELEKKVLSSPMTEKLAMQALSAGMKAQSFLQELRTKIQRK